MLPFVDPTHEHITFESVARLFGCFGNQAERGLPFECMQFAFARTGGLKNEGNTPRGYPAVHKREERLDMFRDVSICISRCSEHS